MEFNDEEKADDQKEEDTVDTEEESEDTQEESDDDAEDDGSKSKKKPAAERKQRTPEDELSYHERRAKQLRKKLGKDEDGDKPPRKAAQKDKSNSDELDYGHKAFLRAEGIKGRKEMALVEEYRQNTGRSLEEIVESKHFQADLKALREEETSQDGIPSTTKRTAKPTANSVDYWLAKGELPPDTPENADLRRKVVNAKMKKAQGTDVFNT